MHGSSVFLLALITSVVTAAGTVFVIDKYDLISPKSHAPAETLVPDLHGLSESDARNNANVAHVAILVAAREPNADAKPGTVLRQSVPPGQHVPRDYSLNVVLADETPKVPSVIGLTVQDATARVAERGYTLQVGSNVASATAALGTVVDQTPKADTAQAKGSPVTVQVSSGPGDVEVPKLVGLSVTVAKANLEKLGLQAVLHWISVGETPTYVVLSQKPPAGETVKPGGNVDITACQ